MRKRELPGWSCLWMQSFNWNIEIYFCILASSTLFCEKLQRHSRRQKCSHAFRWENSLQVFSTNRYLLLVIVPFSFLTFINEVRMRFEKRFSFKLLSPVCCFHRQFTLQNNFFKRVFKAQQEMNAGSSVGTLVSNGAVTVKPHSSEKETALKMHHCFETNYVTSMWNKGVTTDAGKLLYPFLFSRP